MTPNSRLNTNYRFREGGGGGLPIDINHSTLLAFRIVMQP